MQSAERKKAANKRYRQTHKTEAAAYRQAHKAEAAKYGKKYGKKYRQTEAGRASSKRRYKKYLSTVNGQLHYVFYNIRRRCTVPNCREYKWYGNRGIKCLFESADEFVDYVTNVLQVNPRGLDCDRIDNDGNYEKGNIRFVTHKENCQNRYY